MVPLLLRSPVISLGFTIWGKFVVVVVVLRMLPVVFFLNPTRGRHIPSSWMVLSVFVAGIHQPRS